MPPSSNEPQPESGDDPLMWLAEYGDDLLRYAAARVDNWSLAEDLVQETFLAAVTARGRFQGGSSIKTWLIGILRRKIADHYRQVFRRRGNNRQDSTDEIRPPAAPHGRHWNELPAAWPVKPEQQLEQEEFWTTLRQCLNKLGENLRTAFVLRVMDDLDTEEVCSILQISATNLSVRLHRARMLMRECLEKNWFKP